MNLNLRILSYRHDLAELLLKLRQYDKAEKVLKQSLEAESGVCLELQKMDSFYSCINMKLRYQYKKKKLHL